MTALFPPSKQIDPARTGISKSLLTQPCELAAWHSESVRDEQGRRLRLPLPERVAFGSAVDEAVAYVAFHERAGTPWDAAEAVRLGMTRAREMLISEPVEWGPFEIQLGNAVTAFWTLGMGKDRIGETALEWLRSHIAEPGFAIQGNDGESLRSADLVGTPDFVCRHVIDVKTTERAYGPAKFWQSPEMGLYTHLYAQTHDGLLPEYVAYLVYVRVSRPYWQVYEPPPETVYADMIAGALRKADHMRLLLELRNPLLFASNTIHCLSCEWRQPIPDAGFEGCPVGRNIPVAEEAA